MSNKGFWIFCGKFILRVSEFKLMRNLKKFWSKLRVIVVGIYNNYLTWNILFDYIIKRKTFRMWLV